MPVAASGMASGADSNLVQVRMSHRQMRRSRMRQGSASRGNAAMPSRARARTAIRPDDGRSAPLNAQGHDLEPRFVAVR